MIRHCMGLVAAATLLVSAASAGATCIPDEEPDDAFLAIVDQAVGEGEESSRRERVLTGMVTRLMRAGYDLQAVAFATHESALGVTPANAGVKSPDQAITAIRALRFVALGFSADNEPIEEPSARAAWRLNCLNDAEDIANSLIGALETEIRAPADDQQENGPARTSLSVESSLNLLSLMHLERAEVLRDKGDHYFRTLVDKKDAPPTSGQVATRLTGAAELALATYRQAELSLATAMAAAGDDRLARIRLIGNELAERKAWLRQGQAFGGRSYDAPTRPIGFSTEQNAVGFTILDDLGGRIEELKTAAEVYNSRITTSDQRLVDDLTRFATFNGEAETYRQVRLQSLFAELDRIDLLEADQALELTRIVAEQGEAARDRDARKLAEQQEFEARRAAAAQRMAESLPNIAARLASLADLGPLDTPAVVSASIPDREDPLWEEDVALFERIYGTCGQELAPTDRPVLNRTWAEVRADGEDGAPSWAAETLQDLPDRFRQSLEDVLAPAGGPDIAEDEFTAGFRRLVNAASLLGSNARQFESEDAKLEERWKELMRECWELGAQLNIERALLLNTQLDLRQEHLDEIYRLTEDAARATTDGLINDVEQGAFETEEQLTRRLMEAQDRIVDAATQQIRQKIAHTERLMGEAKRIIEQVIQTGENVERAAQAADAVYTAMTAVPVGSGPGGVFFERETLVALNESAVQLARFTYRATNDIFRIRQQLGTFEGKLIAYKDDLAQLSLKTSVENVTRELSALERDTAASIEEILQQTQEAMLGRIEGRRAELQAGVGEILASAVTLSDSRAALIERQLEAVFDELEELPARRDSLAERQLYALRELKIDMAASMDLARAVAHVQQDLEAVLARQNLDDEQKRRDQARVMENLYARDATVARRVEEIMEQVELIRNDEDENPWSGARDLAVRFLDPPPQLNGDALEHALRLRRALDAAGDAIFELAVALKYLTQSDEPLLFAVQPTSAEDARRLREALVDIYREHIQNNLRPDVQVIALRITPAAAAAWGQVEGRDGPAYPRCLDQDDPDARCLRIVTTYGPRWHWNELAEEEDRALRPAASPQCEETVYLPTVLDPNFPPGQVTRDVRVLGPANAAGSGGLTPAYCPGASPPRPDKLRAASMSGELVFVLNQPADNSEGLLIDAVVATSDKQANINDTLPSSFSPVGSTTAACKSGGALHTRLIDRPFSTFYEREGGEKPSEAALTPGNGISALRLANERFETNALEEFFGIGATGRRALFFGRGLSNTFDLRLPNGHGLEHEVYVFLFVRYVRCTNRGREEASAAPASPYRSDIETVLTSELLEGAPLARHLIDLEQQMALAGSGRQARLDGLRALLAAGGALDAAPDGVPDHDLDRRAAQALTANLSTYLEALPRASAQPMPKELGELFRCALEGEADCRVDVASGQAGETVRFDAAPVDRPIPLRQFEEVVRLALEPGQDGSAPLPAEVAARMADFNDTLALLRGALAFIDRTVTTERAITRLEALAERRLAMLRDATTMLKIVQPGLPTGIREAACVNHFYADPAFWQLRVSEGRLGQEARRLSLLNGFLNNCLGNNPRENEQCIAISRSLAEGTPAAPTNDTDLTCAQLLGLGDSAEAFARALGQARDIDGGDR